MQIFQHSSGVHRSLVSSSCQARRITTEKLVDRQTQWTKVKNKIASYVTRKSAKWIHIEFLKDVLLLETDGDWMMCCHLINPAACGSHRSVLMLLVINGFWSSNRACNTCPSVNEFLIFGQLLKHQIIISDSTLILTQICGIIKLVV